MIDTTAIWVFVKRNEQYFGYFVIAVVMFAAGWQVGRAMSPYYASHPIVFSDTQSLSSGGSAEELQALQQEGIANRPPPREAPAVAAATTTQAQGQFVASVNSTLYHDPSCAGAKQIKPENQRWFGSAQEAQAAGYQPSKCTLDKHK